MSEIEAPVLVLITVPWSETARANFTPLKGAIYRFVPAETGIKN